MSAVESSCGAVPPAAAHAAADSEEYLGMVKSYNARRGFGFVACEQTAERFGRDVYIAKAEAQLVTGAENSAAHCATGAAPRPGEKVLPTLAEGDLVRFRVKLSAEGYPQAEQLRCIRKFHGTVLEAPSEAPQEGADADATTGRVASDELERATGCGEAALFRAACGRARLAVGDRVTFCFREADSSAAGERPTLEALLVILMPRSQQSVGCILGCFVLDLPRAPLPGSWANRPNLKLDCHALGDRLILSGLPQDVDQNELLRFFTKHGATHASIAHSSAGSFASIAFSGLQEVPRFVGRAVHTFADDKETRLARLLPRCPCATPGSESARLPGLPVPALAPCPEQGALSVAWSPVLLATGYAVELRPAGVQAQWSLADASSGRLNAAGSSAGAVAARFGKDCNSCKVTGLPSNVVFEARVTYFTACGCCSDFSDASEWCMAHPGAAPQPSPQQQQKQQQAQQQAAAAMAANMAAMQFLPPAMGGGVGGFHAATSPLVPQLLPFREASQQPWPQMGQMMQQAQFQAGGCGGCGGCHGGCGSAWRCMHGTVLTSPSMPELRAADEFGFSMLVQWPAVAHASAYVVELRESGSARAERFVRSVPMQAQGSIVELRIGGLRPSGQGSYHIAQVRAVAPCGCESEPSPAALSQPAAQMGAMQMNAMQVCATQPQHQAPQMQPQPQHQPQHQPPQQMPQPCAAQQHQQLPVQTLSLAAACTPPPSPAPPSPPSAAQQQPKQQKLAPWQMQTPAATSPERQEQAKLTPWQMQMPAPANASPNRLPSLLQSARATAFPAQQSQAPPPPPAGCAPEVVAAKQEAIAPEIAGQEECIILD